MPDVAARKVRVFGRVQGVFFRQATVNHARTFGVAGWVHNARDGSVEAHIEGEIAAVEDMIAWMRQGPSQARVEDVTVEDAEPTGVAGFSVRL